MKRIILLIGLLLSSIPAYAQEVQKEITNLGGKSRAYYLFVPDKLTKEQPAPLLVFLHDLISELQTKYPIDEHRIYLFGHSGGASFALYMALYESEYFAATAIHAGALRKDDDVIVARAKRKIPIQIAVGTVDRSFP